MSLLLDALKKAAEQKAKKSEQEAAPKAGDDETVIIDGSPDDATALDAGDVDERSRREIDEDATELTDTGLEGRYEQTRLDEDEDERTATQVEVNRDQTDAIPSDQLNTGEDETIVFGDEDVSEFLGDDLPGLRKSAVSEDSTDLRYAGHTDETQADVTQADVTQADVTAAEVTQADVTAAEVTQADVTQADVTAAEVTQAEVTQADVTAAEVTQAEVTQAEVTQADVTQADVTQADLTHADQEQGEETEADVTRSDVTRSEVTQTDVRAQTSIPEVAEPRVGQPGESASDGDATETSVPQDLSLLLQDPDSTSVTTRTSQTDPRDAAGVPVANEDDLALIDTTRHNLPSEPTSTTEATTQAATTQSSTVSKLDTLTTEGTTTRTGTTATRTYAPDNYDRTLMKLPTDDASKLFAGMKSDGDVVMTPDYAKKVFQSKSSAQRMQHFKVYVLIFAGLLGAVGFYGVFEYSSQSDAIEASLLPLKRDPMPGVIRKPQEEDTQLFTDSGEVSQQTLEIVESADGDVAPAVADQGVIAGDDAAATAGESTQDTAAAAESTGAVAQVGETVPAEPGSAGDDAATLASMSDTASKSDSTATDSGVIASLDSESAAAAESAPASGNLEIITSSRPDELQIKLSEAYDAYQAGNDARALELYNEVLREDPGNRNALLGRAAIYVQNDNVVGAVDDYQTLLLANPKDSLAMSSLISVANLSPQESESRLKLMIREEPQSPHLNFALGNAYGAQNRWLEAQSFYFTALQHNPDDPNYAYNLAVSLEHIEQPRAAMAYYRLALDNIGNGLATFSKEVVDQRLEILGRL